MATAGLAVQGHLPLVTLREGIQPFPAFSGVYVASLKAQHNAIMAERRPAGAGARRLAAPGAHLCPECDAGE
jgi:dihydrolipoamide dehydrogenase